MLFGALFFVSAAETGCAKQDLDRRKNEGFVKIDLLWDGATPKGSKFYFYPQDNVEAAVESPVECPPEGFRGNLPAGTYRIIVYNSDVKNVAMRYEDNYERAEIYVLPESKAEAGVSGTRADECIAQPGDLMLAAAIDGSDAGLLVVPYQQEVEVTAKPALRVKHLRFLFKVDDAGQVSLSDGTLSGVSSSLNCASAACSSTSESVNFTVTPTTESGYAYEARISVLDLVRPGNASHLLTLNLMRPDGTPYQIVVDLSATIDNILAENGGSIPVTVPVTIPIELKKIGNDLKADVAEWTPGTGGGTLE